MLFDQRLVHDFLAGGVKPSPVAPKLASEKRESLPNLSSRVSIQSTGQLMNRIYGKMRQDVMFDVPYCSVLLCNYTSCTKTCPQLQARNERPRPALPPLRAKRYDSLIYRSVYPL